MTKSKGIFITRNQIITRTLFLGIPRSLLLSNYNEKRKEKKLFLSDSLVEQTADKIM